MAPSLVNIHVLQSDVSEIIGKVKATPFNKLTPNASLSLVWLGHLGKYEHYLGGRNVQET